MKRLFLLLYYLIFISTRTGTTVISATLLPSEINGNGKINTSSSGGTRKFLPVQILRFRLPKTGTIIPIQVNEEDFKSTPLRRMVEGVLAAHGGSSFNGLDNDEYECTFGTELVDTSQPPLHLGLKHGTLLTITQRLSGKEPNENNVASDIHSANDRRRQKRGHQQQPNEAAVPFDPFPHLAKPKFNEKRSAIRAKANRRGGMSYSDLDQLSASIHKVETQPDPIIARIYMCSKSAEAFFASCSSTSSTKNAEMKKKKTQHQQKQKHKCALLFGTVSKEKMKSSNTLLDGPSTATVSDKKDRYCEVVKVQALYEPPQQKVVSGCYDATSLISLETSTPVQRAIQLAKRLNLQPVGWIYTHNNNKNIDNVTTKKNEVPVSARDVVLAAKIQAALMKTLGRETGGRFVTVSLDVASGESEAFQMSDQCIQMVAEGVLLLPQDTQAAHDEDNYDSSNNTPATVIKTSSPVIVDGQETRTVDCLLFLVNTGMLSHIGSLSGDGDIIGKLTSKVKQKLLTYLAQGDDSKTIHLLSNFNLLLALSKVLSEADFNELCDFITKSTRRAKIILSKHLQLTLESIASA